METRAWAIYYGDGGVWPSDAGDWKDAPDQGVQVVVVYHDPPYRTLYDGRDVYYAEGRTYPKYGQQISDADFYRIQDNARTDPHPLGEG
ncbi:MAG: hypothetical protein K0S99_448 [Thermomicrobiales bacterium]|jgi:hypothetical protein|nr:hypothetical protein [Thermomicrobiales bacterium]